MEEVWVGIEGFGERTERGFGQWGRLGAGSRTATDDGRMDGVVFISLVGSKIQDQG